MVRLLAIDPGARSGFAVFDDGKLVGACYASPNDTIVTGKPDLVIIEFPMIYPRSKARPNDITKLAAIAGRYQERYKAADLHQAFPREWKGTIDGDVMTDRIKAALTRDELVICAAKNFDHNMLDAVGLGKWAMRQPWYRVRASR